MAKETSSPLGSGAYFAIRVAVGSAIMMSFYLTRGFGSKLETFVMAFVAALASQAVAFAVKLVVGDTPRNSKSVALLVASVIAIAGAVVFVVIDEQSSDGSRVQVHGLLDYRTLERTPDAVEFQIIDGDKRITIHHRGVLSDQARDRMEILARGYWRGDVFEATEVLPKCPSSYPSPGAAPSTQYR